VGAIVGALGLTILPEIFRGLVDYRYLLSGLVLVLLIRFRPQGLLGTEKAMALLEIGNLSRNFDGVRAVDVVSFDVTAGEFCSFIGPNGAGKTTLFNLITGPDQPTHGTILFEGKSLVGLHPDQFASRGIARTFQHGRVFANLSVLDNVLVGAHTRFRASR